MSIRNGEIRDLVLDATARCLLRGGGRRLTVSEVAKEAGVSRPTVYRRWPDIDTVVRSLLTREVLVAVEQISEAIPGHDLGAVVERVVRVVGELRGNLVLCSLWREQREFMAPYVYERLGSSQQQAIVVLAEQLGVAQEHGSARAGDPSQMAAMVLVIAQSFLQSGPLIAELMADDWESELHRALTGYLAAPSVAGR